MRITIILAVTVLVLSLSPFVLAEEDDTPEWDGVRFELENLDGDELEENDVFSDGELYLVDFWASWCKPCNMYLPHLEEIVEEYGDRGFRVVIFVVDDAGSISSARSKLAAEEYPFTILFDPEADVQSDLGVKRIPTTIFFDPEGEELWRHVGYSSGDEDEIRKQIEEYLPGETEECDGDEDSGQSED